MNIQFKKGVLELCALSLLRKSDRYGYELVSIISKKIDISDGTVYPLLRRLKNDGYVTTYIEESSTGPARKYYSLTESGHKEYEAQRAEWNTFLMGVTSLLEGGAEV